MNAYPNSYSLREIDQHLGLPKGAAFRAFKGMEPSLKQDTDYFLLRADEDRAAIDSLRCAKRIYASSRNVVMLSSATYEKVLARLKAMPASPK